MVTDIADETSAANVDASFRNPANMVASASADRAVASAVDDEFRYSVNRFVDCPEIGDDADSGSESDPKTDVFELSSPEFVDSSTIPFSEEKPYRADLNVNLREKQPMEQKRRSGWWLTTNQSTNTSHGAPRTRREAHKAIKLLKGASIRRGPPICYPC